MQSTSEGCLNIAELANQLKREKIFINSERQLLQTLNAEVEKCTLELLQAAWICSQQRQNLATLITSRSEADSIAACQKASLLEATTFIDAFKVFKYKEANALSELLGWLRDSPQLVALFLLLGEEELGSGLASALASGLYASGRCPSDRGRLLAVIRSLIKHQLALPQPRKLFRSGACALSQLYSVFRDGYTPLRQFLVAALQGPVMNVLREDEFFLDLDPDKAMERFSSSDRLKKFGQPSSAEYQAKVARYRKWTVQSLYNLASRFVASLKEHWPSFPPALAWLLHQVVMLMKQAGTPEREIHGLCSELVMTQVICPAVASPEAHGVLETPVSYIARSNLLQIAQILQMLSLAKFQEVDPKVRDVYSRFDRACIYTLLEAAAAAGGAGGGGAESPRAEPPPAAAAALLTDHQLKQLITFLKHVSSKLNNNTPATSEETSSSGSSAVADASTFSDSGSTSLAQLVPGASRARLSDLLRQQPDMNNYRPPPPEPRDQLDNGSSKMRILNKLPLRARAPASPPDERPAAAPQVIVINLPNGNISDTVGLVPESKVLECYYGGSEAGDADEAGSALAAAGPAPVQKRTRFSVSHDEVSLGNTSDNLEAVSEAASNHSCTSSLELEPEDQNDNLSDMVSANVSGRGSPNISGRETPSSQVTDGDAAGEGPPRRLPQNVPVNQANSQQAKLLKQTRNDIEDKFCKFEIKKLLEGDETISIMSDTWSTDVLASDSETIGDSCDQANHNQGANTNNANAPDVSETASESAWSIDVLASDSDRNTEVDTDDCVSVAARSDTSWPRRPSAHEDSVPRAAAARGSPRHAAMPHRTGYLSATAQLSRGAELDLMARSPGHNYAPIENRKSILVNGYPVMTCYTASAPESPSTSAPAPLAGDVFDYGPQNNDDVDGENAATESTVDGGNNSDATSQWVDDSFPPRAASPRDFPSTSKMYEQPDDRSCDQSCDQSRGSSESEFNAMSVSQYDRRFDSGIDTDRPDERSALADLVTRMSSASITSNLVNNLTARIVKSEIRTSIVSISSSSRVEKRQTDMSLSNLSVNSVETGSDKSSSQDVNSEQVTERRVSPPPLKASTGAIPKSISFDATAEKNQRRRIMGEEGLAGNLDELKNNVKRSGGNILHKIKMFRQKGRSINSSSDITLPFPSPPAPGGESSDDILAKYRRAGPERARRPSRPDPEPADLERLEGVVDLNDPEVFNSMKRRLRLVMSNPELHPVDHAPSRTSRTSLTQWVRAAAVSATTVTAGAHATELARALAGATATAGGDTAAARLAAALRADLAARRPYANYLNSCRAGLTHTLHTLNSQISTVRSEWSWCVRCAAAARVVEQLDRGGSLRRLARTHHHNTQRPSLSGELMDEKAARLTANIKAITAEVKADPSWEGASPAMLEMVEITVERAAFARLYLHVLFPNGDGDIARDQVLSEHIRRLSAGVSCAALGVPARHLWAAPFRSAQLALSHLPVYTTPRDKLACISRCVTCIMAALGLTEGAAAAADDLTPVLVFVIIKVNPPSLLSTIELVQALGGPALAGEALCWWTHFCAAVAYIKTMDYPRT